MDALGLGDRPGGQPGAHDRRQPERRAEAVLSRIARVALVATLVLAAATGAYALARGAASRGQLRAGAHGAVRIVSSRDGVALVTARDMRPGDETDGTVRIANDGDEATSVTLTSRTVRDTPGPHGGRLSQALRLRVEDLTAGGPAVVYDGPLTALPATSLGPFASGEARTYRFTVVFPDGGPPESATTGDNALQGASVDVRYRWRRTALRSAASESPTELALASATVGSVAGLLRDGVRLGISCSAPCTATGRLSVARATARRLGIPANVTAHAAAVAWASAPAGQVVVVGRSSLYLAEPGRAALTVRPEPLARRRIARARRVVLLLGAELRDSAGRLHQRLRRRLVFEQARSGRGRGPDAGEPSPRVPGARGSTDGSAAPGSRSGGGAVSGGSVPQGRSTRPDARDAGPGADDRGRSAAAARPHRGATGTLAAGVLIAAALALAGVAGARRRGRRRDE